MSIETDLKKDGITILRELDTLTINTLAQNASFKLCSAFPNQKYVCNDLFIKLSRIPMYLADIPDGFAEASYFYKNSAIYFKNGYSSKELEEFAIHEFIHYLQEVRDSNNKLIRLGLCEYGEFKTHGLALNEGAVQYMASKALNSLVDNVKYYGIDLPTNSPNYYPILCNLVAQIGFLIGEDYLFESTLSGNSIFFDEFINYCGSSNITKLQNYLDLILKLEEKIIKSNSILMSDDCEGSKAQKISDKINKYKSKLKTIYFKCQNLIFTSYFNNYYKNIKDVDSIDACRFKLYTYKDYIGTSDNYSEFNNFYLNKMIDLDHKYEQLSNNTSIAVVKKSLILTFFKKIKSLLSAETNLN